MKILKKANIVINYYSKVQVLEGGNPDVILDFAVLNSLDPEVTIVDFELEDGRVLVDKENLDFFRLDTRFKVSLEYTGDLEEVLDGAIEFDVNDMFVVWDWEMYGWGMDFPPLKAI